jgi:hypothetical protein
VTELDGVRAKLALARANAEQLEALLRPVVEAAQRSIERMPSENPFEVVYKITKVPWIDPAWSAIFGQGIYNIRSALDHLAWQLVLLDGQEPTRDTQFPLLDASRDKSGRKVRVDIAPGIKRPDILAAVESMQPYHGGGKWGDQLGVVAELSRIDKHRLPIAVSTMLNADNIFWGLPEGYTTPSWWFPVGKALNEGDVVAKFLFSEPVAPDRFDPHLVPQIALDEAPLGSPYRTQDLASLLGGLARIAAFKIDTLIVAPLFEGELPAWIAPGPPRPDTSPRTGTNLLRTSERQGAEDNGTTAGTADGLDVIPSATKPVNVWPAP